MTKPRELSDEKSIFLHQPKRTMKMKTLYLILLLIVSTAATAEVGFKWSVEHPEQPGGHTVISDYVMTPETMQFVLDWAWDAYPQTIKDPATGDDTGVQKERTTETEIDALIDWSKEQRVRLQDEVNASYNLARDAALARNEALGCEVVPPRDPVPGPLLSLPLGE